MSQGQRLPFETILCKRESIVAVPLSPQTKSLETLKEEESAKGVQCWSDIAEELQEKVKPGNINDGR